MRSGITHELKTDPEVFQAMWDGLKTYELRYNDRDFQKGDILILKQTERSAEELDYLNDCMPSNSIKKETFEVEYTGRELKMLVTHVLHGPAYGLVDGWCIMSVKVYSIWDR
jgi:hypothetical protein